MITRSPAEALRIAHAGPPPRAACVSPRVHLLPVARKSPSPHRLMPELLRPDVPSNDFDNKSKLSMQRRNELTHNQLLIKTEKWG